MKQWGSLMDSIKLMRSNVVAQESENAIYYVDKGNLEKVNASTGQTIWTKALTNTGYTPIAGGGVLSGARQRSTHNSTI